jgi:hypothetical protein
LRSGAYSPRVAGPLAEEMLAELLDAEWLPQRLRAPECRGDLEKLALLYARAELLGDEALSMDVDQVVTPRRAGGKNSPFGIWLEVQDQASRLQAKLGLDPIDLLEEQREAEAEARPEEMAALGAEIVARREAELAGG